MTPGEEIADWVGRMVDLVFPELEGEIRDKIDAAVLAERVRCAAVAYYFGAGDLAADISNAIRKDPQSN